ncbi:hypothetical protein CSPX01_13290 [Colletotrichum filicis]|nr:hypothetical protein CSPX01_13290 [Colletotrichum filicis]
MELDREIVDWGVLLSSCASRTNLSGRRARILVFAPCRTFYVLGSAFLLAVPMSANLFCIHVGDGSSVFFIPRRSAMHRGTSWRRSRPLLADDGRPMGTQKKFPPLCVPGFLSMAPCYFDYPGRGRVACRIAPNSEVLSNCLIIDGAPEIGRASIASKARSGQ